MRKLIFMPVCAMTVMVQAEDLIPAGAKNLATSSGPKTTKSANMHTYNSLFNGVRDRWLGYKPNPTTEYYPSETVTFTESRPLVNAYRVWRGQANSSDRDQTRQATTWAVTSRRGGGCRVCSFSSGELLSWYDSYQFSVKRLVKVINPVSLGNAQSADACVGLHRPRRQRAHFQLRQEERSRRPRLRMGCRVHACRDR